MTHEEAIVRKIFKKWWKKNKVGEILANAIFLGKPLVINKKTGEFSNELPNTKS